MVLPQLLVLVSAAGILRQRRQLVYRRLGPARTVIKSPVGLLGMRAGNARGVLHAPGGVEGRKVGERQPRTRRQARAQLLIKGGLSSVGVAGLGRFGRHAGLLDE